jgi:hypothetical protein
LPFRLTDNRRLLTGREFPADAARRTKHVDGRDKALRTPDLIGRATTMRLWIRSRFPVRFEYQVWRKGAGDVPAMSLEREERIELSALRRTTKRKGMIDRAEALTEAVERGSTKIRKTTPCKGGCR